MLLGFMGLWDAIKTHHSEKDVFDDITIFAPTFAWSTWHHTLWLIARSEEHASVHICERPHTSHTRIGMCKTAYFQTQQFKKPMYNYGSKRLIKRIS